MTHLIEVIGNAYGRQRRLFSLVHFVTLGCDARCPHCFVDHSAPSRDGDALRIRESVRERPLSRWRPCGHPSSLTES